MFEKGYTPWNKGKSSWNKGIPMTKEAREKLGKSLKGRKVWNKGKKYLAIRGEKHFRWNGGSSRAYKTGYYSNEYKKWRLAIFERDGFRCQACERIGGYLTAHHIKSFAHYPESRFDLNNGITLCEECHSKTDNYRGRNIEKKSFRNAVLGKIK